jgi:SAM-dependent methyltransferase
MALYDLVTLKTRLQSISTSASLERLVELRNTIDSIKIQIPVLDQKHKDYIDNLVAHYDQVINMVRQPTQDSQEHIELINNQINALTQQLFANNYELEELTGGVDGIRNNRRIYVSEETEQTIKQRILFYTNWRYPALEIGCRDGDWTQYMVAADPLYVIDPYKEFLDSTLGKFTPEYQRRLRTYQLHKHNLSVLPERQFSFIFSWGYFNYVSLDTMKQYLKQIFTLLRDGGVFMFSYNDGDTPAGAGMAENWAQTYMPKSLLLPLAESIGYEVEQSHNMDTNIHWVELKRPGTLSTIKAHQVLGEIKRR